MKPLSEQMRSWNIMEFYNVRKIVDAWADKVAKLEETLTEQLAERGYCFRGMCDGVPEDIERAFNALGICTEEHRAILEQARLF